MLSKMLQFQSWVCRDEIYQPTLVFPLLRSISTDCGLYCFARRHNDPAPVVDPESHNRYGDALSPSQPRGKFITRSRSDSIHDRKRNAGTA
jgi:hypothetical protein